MLKKIALIFCCAILILVALLALILSIFEYRPKPIEDVPYKTGNSFFQKDGIHSLVSWNIGYAGLGKQSDFFLSGGKNVRPSKKLSYEYFEGIKNSLKDISSEIIFLQEADIKAHRSYNVNQIEEVEKALNVNGSFGHSYKCIFVPFPLPPIGKVESGVATFSNYVIESSKRHSLPVLFKWPFRTANLKRCFLATRIPIYDGETATGKYLVLVNFHLEAFDNGQAKIEQTKKLMEYLVWEYEQGNYVIAGGDFNQSFPDAKEIPFVGPEKWLPGKLEKSSLQVGWDYCYDDSVPSCRSTYAPYIGEKAKNHDWQYYLIDGYIKSPNVKVTKVKTIDNDFVYSDHNPIYLEFLLQE